MADKLKNLSHKLTDEDRRKGGLASAETRRKKKLFRDILQDLLNSKIKDFPQFRKAALKIGMADGDTLKDFFAFICLTRSMEKGDLKDLKILQDILGETSEQESTDIIEHLDSMFARLVEVGKGESGEK